MTTRRITAAEASSGATARPRVLRGVVAHLALLRLYTVLPLALLAYAVGAAMGARPAALAGGVLAIACALAGGYAYNDLRDQPVDRTNRPQRPLVSGRLAPGYVRRLVLALFGSAVAAAALSASVHTLAFTLLLIASACLYSDGLKQIPGLKNAFVGLWCGLLPWGAVTDRLTPAVLPAILLVALFIAQKELLADVYDREGDAAAGVRTIPALFGSRTALAIVTGLNVVWWLLARSAGDVPVLRHLPAASEIAAAVNTLVLLCVLVRPAGAIVRAALELQKALMIGGCLGLVAALAR